MIGVFANKECGNMGQKKPTQKEYDVITVGTGPSGATVAAQMAKCGKSVLILEKGRWHPKWMLGKQIASLPLFDKFGLLSTREGMMGLLVYTAKDDKKTPRV